MRGTTQAQPDFLTVINLNATVPAHHPLRAIKRRVDAALPKLSPLFNDLYAKEGRPREIQHRHYRPPWIRLRIMNASLAAPKKVWTEAELQALPEDGFIHELVDGEIVMSPKNNSFQGDICTRLIAALMAFTEPGRLGAVWDSSTGFRMNSLNVRAPDISFISRARLQAQRRRRSAESFFPGAPDLAVEVLSLNNTHKEIEERLKDFFSSGARLAWIIDSKDKRVEVCRSLTLRQWVDGDSFLDGEDILPGFRYPVADLFKPWDWEQEYD